MVIVAVNNLSGTNSTDAFGLQDRKRSRAQPPDGWCGESKVVKKRQVGERAERLKHILEISSSSSSDSSGQHRSRYDNNSSSGGYHSNHISDAPRSPTKLSNGFKLSDHHSTSYNGKTSYSSATLPSKSSSNHREEKTEDSYNWRENLIKMREQIKAVNELPKIETTEEKLPKYHSTPNLTQYSSDKPNNNWSCETSWEIRARYRSMRTEQLYQSQMIKKSGYSWRDKVPEIQKPLKFTEVRSNAVTDVAFIGSSYVRQKDQKDMAEAKVDKSKCPKVMTKVYRIDSSIDIMKLVIKDDLNVRRRMSETEMISYEKLSTFQNDGYADHNHVLHRRLWQMMNFFNFRWQLKLCHPGYDFSREAARVIAASKAMATIMEVDEMPDLEDMKKTEDPAGGDIKSKMTGAIAGLQLVKKKAPQDKPKAPVKVDSKTTAGGGGGDWRSEIKKRERAKQQEKLNAMPLGMPDYREPEKLQIVDWREKLKKEAADDNPMNKWKKFDTGVKKTVRPPPQAAKPKQSKVPKEDPCTCNVGNCKVHSKFALSLKSTSKKSSGDSDSLKRKPSVKKRSEPPPSKNEMKESIEDQRLKILKAELGQQEAPSEPTNGEAEDGEIVEVIKIINFVAIKVATKSGEKKKKVEMTPPPPAPPSAPPPDNHPRLQMSMSPSSSQSSSPPPSRREPSPPSSQFSPPTPPRISPPPPPRNPTPPPPPSHTPPALPPPDTTPTSPVYTRKYFPNPEPVEPYKPKIRDYTPTTVKIKRTEDYVDQPQVFRRQFSSDLEVTPVKFSSSKENCVKKALFVGDQYLGDNIQSFQNAPADKKSNCDKSEEPKPKKKASEKIIEILTAKKIRDEMSPVSSPALAKRRLSEYVSEKLHLAGKSRSSTPVASKDSKTH